jgi:protein-tyrosine phosphatase
MARAAVESGTETLVATPHLHPSFPHVRVSELASRCDHLRGELEREQVALTLVSGAEVSLSWALEAGHEELALASYGQRGTDLLIETPFERVVGFEMFLSGLRNRGYRITLGHPERSLHFQHDRAALHALVDQGVLLQVNAESVLGKDSGRGSKRLARELICDGVAHAIASDGHRAHSWRPVSRLGEAVREVAELVGLDRAEWMADAAPRAIAEGNELPAAPPIAAQPRHRGLFGWR